jgi:ribosomal protein S18 acetylase RimI-like enzyme
MDTIPPVEHERGPYRVTTDPAWLDLDLIHHFLAHESYWAKGIERELVERSIAHSLNFGLYAGEAQIGFARVVTDYATYAYLNDVFVLADYRGQGLGVWLLECVVAHPALQDLLRFGLATRDAQALYQKVGFALLHYPERHMEKLPPGYYKPAE